jgi:hypothetical protein
MAAAGKAALLVREEFQTLSRLFRFPINLSPVIHSVLLDKTGLSSTKPANFTIKSIY